MSAICAAHLSPYRLVPCSQPLQEEKGWVGFPSEAYHCERAALNLWLFLALALDPLLMHNVWEPLLSKLSLPGSLIMYQQRHPRAEACSRIMCNRLRSREVGNASRLTLSTSWCCGVCVCVCARVMLGYSSFFFYITLHLHRSSETGGISDTTAGDPPEKTNQFHTHFLHPSELLRVWITIKEVGVK